MVFHYFENEAVANQIVSGVLANTEYHVQWFNPRTGKWLDMTPTGIIKTDESGKIELLDFPATTAENEDWAARLMEKEFSNSVKIKTDSVFL